RGRELRHLGERIRIVRKIDASDRMDKLAPGIAFQLEPKRLRLHRELRALRLRISEPKNTRFAMRTPARVTDFKLFQQQNAPPFLAQLPRRGAPRHPGADYD